MPETDQYQEIPVGYLETHSLNGLTWKTSRAAREHATEKEMHDLVMTFNAERKKYRYEHPPVSVRESIFIRRYPLRGKQMEITQASFTPYPTITV